MMSLHHGISLFQVDRPYYAFPSSGDAHIDRQLAPNFELRDEIFCMPTCFHMRIPKPSLSAARKPKNLIIFSKKFEIRILTCTEELKSPLLRQYQSYISN